ncbi:hypothetical protein FHX52_0664 [Humibacillus xanthopallidus]|uniref:Uncharacterized protein n=1 Tax=Humibacillus xanthopallidus TaxID=412689 RepID=A0A543PU16_9MICO|nr:hypothetical protein [Humibacillus xanthopallidus]TQN47561.1 hypothetical protein FHX52_0664 [Humibacillus xanthopallidus]
MMLVDCNTCPVRHVRCADCMVTALTAVPLAPREAPRPVLTEAGAAPTPAPAPAEGGSESGFAGPPRLALDRAERHAVSVLLGAGLVTVQEANAARAVPAEGFASASMHSHHAPARSARATRAAG